MFRGADAPGGGGKVPVSPEYVLSRNNDRVVIRNYEGKIFEYPDPTPIPAAEMERLQQEAFPHAGC